MVTANHPRYTSEVTGWATVVAYDPGGTTGWCVMSIRPVDLLTQDAEFARQIKHFAAGQIGGAENEQIDQLAEMADMWSDAAVCGESFVPRKFNQTTEFYAPMRVNAVMGWVLHGNGRMLFTQSPEMAKSRWTDERLKANKSCGRPWYIVGQEHARDGVRHAALFIKRAKAQPTLRFQAWPHLFKRDGELK